MMKTAVIDQRKERRLWVKITQLSCVIVLTAIYVGLFGCETKPTVSARLKTVLVDDRLADSAKAKLVRITRQGRRLTTEIEMPLSPGDVIKTDGNSSAVILFQNGTEVRLTNNTHIKILNPSIRVYIGEILAKVRGFFSTETEYFTAGAEGTKYIVAVGGENDISVIVLDGTVKLESKKRLWKPLYLNKFEQSTSRGNVTPQITSIQPEPFNPIIQQLNRVEYAIKKADPQLFVPNLEGLPSQKAMAELKKSRLGWKIIEVRKGGAKPGTVVNQDPPAGIEVKAGTSVRFEVEAKGPGIIVPNKTVPNVEGLPIKEATAELKKAGLGSEIVHRRTGKGQSGTVVEQKPRPWTEVKPGTTVHLVVESQKGQPIIVPNVEGLPVKEATAGIEKAGLGSEIVHRRTGKGQPGTVVEQNPDPWTEVKPGTTVHLVVESQKGQPIIVPNVEGLPISEATAGIEKAGLDSEIVHRRTGKGQPGTVVEQNPGPWTEVKPGAMVQLVVEKMGLRMPDFRKRHVKDALEELPKLGLQWNIQEVQTRQARPGTVLKQDPSPGTEVKPGATVQLVVAIEKKEIIYRMPDFRKRHVKDALEELPKLGLQWNIQEVQTRQARPGTVLKQDPSPGTEVKPGATVQLVVAIEKKEIIYRMPDFRKRHVKDALEELPKLGLQWKIQEVKTKQARPGTVIRQDPSPGTEVKPGATVQLVVAIEKKEIIYRMPDFRKRHVKDALEELPKLGLQWNIQEVQTRQARPGTVLKQDPSPGTEVKPGATVQLVVAIEKKEIIYRMPDFRKRHVKDALEELPKLGLQWNIQEVQTRQARPGTVLKQDPSPGTEVKPGATVQLVVAIEKKEIIYRMPDFRKRHVKDALEELPKLGLQWKIQEVKTKQARPGTVIRQDPQPGTEVKPGATVQLVVAIEKKEIIYRMPDFRKRHVKDALEELPKLGLQWKIQEVKTKQARPGTVIRQDPQPGTKVKPGATVKLVVAK